MAMQTITRLYDSYDDATAVVQALETAGIPHADISLVSNDTDNRSGLTAPGTMTTADPVDTAAAADGSGTGATLGTVLGGGAGLLAGLGMLAIPGIGPIVAAGWLVATLTGAGVGAAAGGLAGSLAGAGVNETDAHVHAEGVRRGGAVVTVRTDETLYETAEAVLDGRKPVDLSARRAEYETEGWTAHDHAAPAYTTDQITTERKRRVISVS